MKGRGESPKTAILQLEERENRNTAYPNTETAVTNGIKLALSRLQIRLLSRDVYISLDKKVNVLKSCLRNTVRDFATRKSLAVTGPNAGQAG